MPVDTPCLSRGIFQSLPLPTPEPPAPLGLFSPVSLHAQSHTRDQPPSFPLREALARPGPLPVALCLLWGRRQGSIRSLGLCPSQARTRSSRRAQRLPCPLLLCPRLPGQAPGRHVGNVPCGSHGRLGVQSAQQPLGRPPWGRGRHGTRPPPGLAERGLRLSPAQPPAAFPALIYRAVCSAAANPDLELGQAPTATVKCVCAKE